MALPKNVTDHLPGQTEESDGARTTILLVEPDAIFRRLMVRCLGKEGHLVYEATNAEDATAHSEWHTGSIDLVIADLAAAKSRDCQLIRSLIADNPGCRALLIFGYLESTKTPTLDFAAEHIETINKPFGPTALTEKVKHVLAYARD